MANGDIDKAKQTLSLIARRNGNALPSDIEMDSLNKVNYPKMWFRCLSFYFPFTKGMTKTRQKYCNYIHTYSCK